jgi:hypothetical protein
MVVESGQPLVVMSAQLLGVRFATKPDSVIDSEPVSSPRGCSAFIGHFNPRGFWVLSTRLTAIDLDVAPRYLLQAKFQDPEGVQCLKSRTAASRSIKTRLRIIRIRERHAFS